LTEADAAETVFSKLDQQGLQVDMLVNNAGFGVYGEFADADLNTHLEMVQLNIKVLVDLTYLALQGMKQRRSGSILNLASTAAFQPIPYFSTYAATKSFVLSFSESLWHECKPLGIKVLAVCPGPTKTEFFDVADFPDSMKDGSLAQNYTSPETVVEEALKALEAGHANVVTGGLVNQLMVNASRFMPREPLVGAIGRLFRATDS
jgi:short-subunit dehydrogenase